MDEAQLKEILGPLFAELTQSVQSNVQQQLGAFQANIDSMNEVIGELHEARETEANTDTEKAASEVQSENPEIQALQAQLRQTTDALKAMKSEAEQRQLSERRARLDTTLGDYATEQGLISPGLFRDAMKARLGDSLQEVQGNWVVSGDQGTQTLSQYLEGFLESSDGKALRGANSGVVKSHNSEASKSSLEAGPRGGSATEQNSEQALNEMFAKAWAV